MRHFHQGARQAPDGEGSVQVKRAGTLEWIPASRALEGWRRGEVLLHPPNLNVLRGLARPGPIDLAALRDPPHRDGFFARRIEFQEGFFLAALRTPTLPPATHTNSWLVPDGQGGLAVIDPGPEDPAKQQRLFELLDSCRQGLQFTLLFERQLAGAL